MPLLRLAFSPDSDDIFMFWPLLQGKIPLGPYTFEHVRSDTQALNEQAKRGDGDIVAVSVASYPDIYRDYMLLPHGGSIGRGYGPVLITPKPRALETLRGQRIGVPGFGTTAYLVLRMMLEEFTPVVLPISPFARSFEAVRNGEVDAALLIHEGRLRYEEEGFACVLDLGSAWAEKTGGLPLPLGGNVIRRTLGEAVIRDVSALLRQSIRWALDHREDLLDTLLAAEQRSDAGVSRSLLDRYLAMYANEDTAGYSLDARQACERLMKEGQRLGLYAEAPPIDWAP